MTNQIMLQLQPVTDTFVNYPIVVTLVILIMTLVIASIVTFLLIRVVGGLANQTRFFWDEQVVAALRRPLFWTLFLFGFLLSVQPLGLPRSLQGFLQSLVATGLVIIWTGFALRFIRIVLKAMSRSSVENSIVRPQTRPLFENLGFIVILVVSVYAIFRSWNIDMTAWLASAGVIGIAVGFAAKDTLANLFSGVFILADAPYKIGDYVVLDGGDRGKVTHIGIRSTRLLTRDDVEITIPNAIMGNTKITNESGGPYEKFRLRVRVGIAYGSDIDQVREILMDIATREPLVCDEPEPRVRFRTFGGSSLDLDLLCWVEKPEVRGQILDILNTAIYKRFNAQGIEIPYSKHDLYIREMPKDSG